MTNTLIVIVAVSVAAVFGMFVLGKCLDRCGTGPDAAQNGGAR